MRQKYHIFCHSLRNQDSIERIPVRRRIGFAPQGFQRKNMLVF